MIVAAEMGGDSAPSHDAHGIGSVDGGHVDRVGHALAVPAHGAQDFGIGDGVEKAHGKAEKET